MAYPKSKSRREDRAFAQWSTACASSADELTRLAYLLVEFRFPHDCAGAQLYGDLLRYVVVAKTDSTPMTTGHFLAFNSAFGQFFGSALGMSSAALTVITVIPVYERAKAIVEAVPEIDRVKADPGELSGSITSTR